MWCSGGAPTRARCVAVWLCAEFSAASPGLDRALATAAQQHRAATELMLNSELVSVSSAVTVW